MTVDPRRPQYITVQNFKDKVIIGNGGTEQSCERICTAYHTDTGEMAWRFGWSCNPADGFESKAMEMAAKTWTGEWWKMGGGGNTWHGITYDQNSIRSWWELEWFAVNRKIRS